MRTSSFSDPFGREWTIHHNGDFSGDAEIRAPGSTEAVSIPNEVIFAYVAEAIRAERISQLEQADAGDLLGGSLHIAKRLASRPKGDPYASLVPTEINEVECSSAMAGAISPEVHNFIGELVPALLLEFRGRPVVFGPTVNRHSVSAETLEQWFRERGVEVKISGCYAGLLSFASAKLTGTHRLVPQGTWPEREP